MSKPEKASFSDHLSELRNRFLVVLATFFVSSLLGYVWHEQLFDILVSPLNQPLYYSAPAGGLNFTLQLSFFFGGLCCIPILVYQIVKFVEPTFSHRVRKMMPLVLGFSTVMLGLGMAFAYYGSLPATLFFLDKFTSEQVVSLISTEEYFSFISRYILGFGFLFQLPVVLWCINSIKKLSVRTLWGYQRWVIVVSFIIAAVLTPTPDFFNQLIMALPIILLYEISLLGLFIFNHRAKN